ncbi:hypothetical protein ERJ75_000371400 [Trypanosoma vivax]|nr:hypothetical protein ERJ75_000371400 [Trypanosoma vivax]
MRTTGEPNGNRWSGVARCLDGACRALGPRDGREEWRGEADNKPRSAGDKGGTAQTRTRGPECGDRTARLHGTWRNTNRCEQASAKRRRLNTLTRGHGKGKTGRQDTCGTPARTGEALPGGSAQAWPDGPADANSKRRRMSALRRSRDVTNACKSGAAALSAGRRDSAACGGRGVFSGRAAPVGGGRRARAQGRKHEQRERAGKGSEWRRVEGGKLRRKTVFQE